MHVFIHYMYVLVIYMRFNFAGNIFNVYMEIHSVPVLELNGKKVNIEKEAWNWNKKVKSLLKKENKHGWGKKTRLCEGQWAYKKKPTV